MRLSFKFEQMHSWPALAWVAWLEEGSDQVIVHCGIGVETDERWIFEAVWDGEFSEAEFDKTDIVAGSGVRLREETAVFVSSGSILDRLNYIDLGHKKVVSNSSSALVAEIGATVDPSLHHYQAVLGSIILGLDKYLDHFETSRGDIRFLYFENLSWDGRTLKVVRKPRPIRDFSTYAAYINFLQSTMDAVVANANHPSRRSTMSPIVPISNGYDSPTVAVLASRAGVTAAITMTSDRDGKDDSGLRIAERLGFETVVAERQSWRKLEYVEVDSIAGSGAAGEVAFEGLSEHLKGRLMLSGLWGGAVWKYDRRNIEPIFSGHDGSGLCFTEMRLKVGFIHCPVPFWGGMQVVDIAPISRSAEMEDWSIPGPYNRPIARRLVESAGIPREWFGQQKHGASEHVLGAEKFLTDKSAKDFKIWILRNSRAWWRRGRIPPYPVFGEILDFFLRSLVAPIVRRVIIPLMRRVSLIPGLHGFRPTVGTFRKWFDLLMQEPLQFRRYTFPWALERSARKYSHTSSSSTYNS